MEEEIKKLKEINRKLDLFRSDISGYVQFLERNIEKGHLIVALENKLKRIEEQASRWKRANSKKDMLLRDLGFIEEICNEKIK